MLAPVLTLTTDFGATEYVAQMKGAILSVHPEARIVDVSHEVQPQNVLEGAYVMAATVPYFPKGTVHVGVVDPGVGTVRRGLAIQCRRGWLVGPDNGLLWPAAEALGLEQVRALEDRRFFRKTVSATFHGRDVFAPVAAHLAVDGPDAFGALGSVVDDAIRLRLGEGAAWEGSLVRGVVLHVDRFGNVVTNVPADMVERWGVGSEAAVEIAQKPHRMRRVSTYGDGGPDEPVLLISSSGFLEVAMNEENAARRLGVRPGLPVAVHFTDGSP
jgi:S-adenosylmethionine hydrolase